MEGRSRGGCTYDRLISDFMKWSAQSLRQRKFVVQWWWTTALREGFRYCIKWKIFCLNHGLHSSAELYFKSHSSWDVDLLHLLARMRYATWRTSCGYLSVKGSSLLFDEFHGPCLPHVGLGNAAMVASTVLSVLSVAGSFSGSDIWSVCRELSEVFYRYFWNSDATVFEFVVYGEASWLYVWPTDWTDLISLIWVNQYVVYLMSFL